MTWTLWGHRTPTGEFDYAAYVAAQAERNASSLNHSWVDRRTIAKLSAYIQTMCPHPQRGLCHGTRTGNEQRWFREDLPGCEVWGTEIAPTALQYPYTLHWDFHDVEPEWLGSCDFIYSNALDHSYDPARAIRAWMSCLKPDGLCLVDWVCHPPIPPTAADVFSATLPEVVMLITEAGGRAFGIVDVFQTPFKQKGGRPFVFKGPPGTRYRSATIVMCPGSHPPYVVPPEWETGPLPRLRLPRRTG